VKNDSDCDLKKSSQVHNDSIFKALFTLDRFLFLIPAFNFHLRRDDDVIGQSLDAHSKFFCNNKSSTTEPEWNFRTQAKHMLLSDWRKKGVSSQSGFEAASWHPIST